MSASDRNKVALGASVLVLGLVTAAAGFLYYRKKTRGERKQEVMDNNDMPWGYLKGSPHSVAQNSGE